VNEMENLGKVPYKDVFVGEKLKKAEKILRNL
jgi:hypothetical protein